MTSSNALRFSTRPYRCTPSVRLEPDGKQAADSSARGLRCSTIKRLGTEPVARYVAFSPDGTVSRDYVIR